MIILVEGCCLMGATQKERKGFERLSGQLLEGTISLVHK